MMKLRKLSLLLLVALLAHGGIAAAQPSPESIILASTTSVENSGLLPHILLAFTKETGITEHVLAQGTGQALQTAARNDADLVLVHDPEAEEKFIAAGDGIDRRQIAWNDFIVVGPRSDPAHIAGGHDAVEALKAIAGAQAPSRAGLISSSLLFNAELLNLCPHCRKSALENANDLVANLGRRESGSVYDTTPSIDLIFGADDHLIGIAIHGDEALRLLDLPH